MCINVVVQMREWTTHRHINTKYLHYEKDSRPSDRRRKKTKFKRCLNVVMDLAN